MPVTEAKANFKQFLLECDQWIKAGKFSKVSDQVGTLNFANVPREFKADLAKICRRAGLISQGLRLLHPTIRSERTLETPPTAHELCEYSVLLSRNGSVDEALSVLSTVDPEKYPEALLYRGFCHISKWEYANAVPFLESFLLSSADDYQKLIAKVNLVACSVAVRDIAKGLQILPEILAQAEKLQSSRLIGNSLEMKAQLFLLQNDFEAADFELEKARQIFTQPESFDHLMILKWQTISQALKNSRADLLLQFRKEAAGRNHWESLREADLFSCVIDFDQKRFDHLVFGTPMPAYRQRVYDLTGGSPSSSYLWGSDRADAKVLDLQDTESFKSNKIHQMMVALTRDLYIPKNMGTLFAELYPQEYFDVQSSPLRVRQWISRTRQWLEAENLPWQIEQIHGTYRFSESILGAIRLPLNYVVQDPLSCQLQALEKHFLGQPAFSADQACKVLNISRSSFHRLARWGVQNGDLQAHGEGRARLHTLCKKAA